MASDAELTKTRFENVLSGTFSANSSVTDANMNLQPSPQPTRVGRLFQAAPRASSKKSSVISPTAVTTSSSLIPSSTYTFDTRRSREKEREPGVDFICCGATNDTNDTNSGPAAATNTTILAIATTPSYASLLPNPIPSTSSSFSCERSNKGPGTSSSRTRIGSTLQLASDFESSHSFDRNTGTFATATKKVSNHSFNTQAQLPYSGLVPFASPYSNTSSSTFASSSSRSHQEYNQIHFQRQLNSNNFATPCFAGPNPLNPHNAIYANKHIFDTFPFQSGYGHSHTHSQPPLSNGLGHPSSRMPPNFGATSGLVETIASNFGGQPIVPTISDQIAPQEPSQAIEGQQQSHRPTTKRTRRRTATMAQRRAANIRERRRMFNLNSAFDRLRKKVPTFAYEKRLSRIDTLRLAMMYIKFMTEIVHDGQEPNFFDKHCPFAQQFQLLD